MFIATLNLNLNVAWNFTVWKFKIKWQKNIK